MQPRASSGAGRSREEVCYMKGNFVVKRFACFSDDCYETKPK